MYVGGSPGGRNLKPSQASLNPPDCSAVHTSPTCHQLSQLVVEHIEDPWELQL